MILLSSSNSIILAELHDLAGITLYRPCLQAIMSSKEYIELTQGFTVATELSELEAKYLKHLDKLHSSYVMLLKTWYGLCHDANARLRTNSGKDSWVSKKEDVASKCNEARIQYLKFIYSRKEMHIKVATVRTNKLAELIKFFMNIEVSYTQIHFQYNFKDTHSPPPKKLSHWLVNSKRGSLKRSLVILHLPKSKFLQWYSATSQPESDGSILSKSHINETLKHILGWSFKLACT